MANSEKITSYKELRRYLDCDMRSRSVDRVFWALFTDPIVRFTVALRLNEYLFNRNVNMVLRAVPLFYFRRLSVRLGFSIPLNVFSEGLAIVHYGTIIVSPAAKVGRNCRIHAGVNIGGSGGLMDPEDAKHMAPTIGDNCYIGPGAKIYGPIEIGPRCVIGANAVVGRSFPNDEQTIAGVPARAISTRGSAGMLVEGCPLALGPQADKR